MVSQQSSQKKQQSISSFFSSKPAAKTQLATPKATHDSSLRRYETENSNSLFVNDNQSLDVDDQRESNTPKRSLDDDEDDFFPAPKRAKQNAHDNGVDTKAGDESITGSKHSHRRSLSHIPVNTVANVQKPKVTARTSKYVFSSSALTEEHDANIKDDEDAEDDEESRKIKQRLHQKWVKRLGKPDSMAEIKRRNPLAADEMHGEEDGPEDGEGEGDDEPASTKSQDAKGAQVAKRGRDKLTPMEKQVIAIKTKHMDTLLAVEVGYKFRFFGEDARIASKELNIWCKPGKYRFDEHPSEAHLDGFASASIPVQRLHVHVKRLVSAGHKVGVVRQLETAALKKAGTNRNTTFERGLTNLYTKGTYIDDQEALEAPQSGFKGDPATGHLLCLTETDSKGTGSDEKVQIGLVAVQPNTGDVIYDDFEDGFLRSELETRLLHIAPCEFLIVGDVSKATKKLVQHLSGSKMNVFGDRARVERVDKPKTMAAQAYSHITSFYANLLTSNDPTSSQVESSQETGTILDKVHQLSENATVCLSAMITHLTEYSLQHVFDLTKNFQSFSARSHMLLNGNTLNSLEIYRNQTDSSERGSLFWTLDRTQTRFGQRLLRKWVGRPFLDRQRLEERLSAVEELKDRQQTIAVDRIKQLLRNIKTDLEKSLIRIYYRKCTRPELLAVLQTLQMIAQEYAHVQSDPKYKPDFQSQVVNDAIESLPKISNDVVLFLERINTQAAKADDKYSFFRDEFETEDMLDHKVGIVAVEHDLNEFKKVASEKIKKPKIEYATVAGIDYLIEVDNGQLKNIPASWAKISGTKKLSRYHAPEVVKLIRERDQHKEALANAADSAFVNLLAEISSKYQTFRDCIQSLALLDCLLSMAEIAMQPGYCKPEFLKDGVGIEIEGGRHPMVEQLLLDAFVPNDVHLSAGETRALLITGPNMGGKSSYVRSVALIAIMAQIGSYVPADSARLSLLDAVFTRMGAFDNMMKGESTFMVELSETSDILKQATPRSLVILDELGRGTSTHDGVAIAQAVLDFMVTRSQSMTLFITHYQSMAKLADHFGTALRNVYMRFTERDTETGEKDITFLYEVAEGIAHRSYGLNVAKLAGLPKSLLDEASRRSKQMEEEEGSRKLNHAAKVFDRVARDGNQSAFDQLVACLEQI